MKENTFSKKMVIAEKWVFKATICGELRVRSRGFSISARKNGLSFSRLGMCVSKKAIRSSVIRNSVKRKVREDFRLFSSKDMIGFDIVVRVLRDPRKDFFELGNLWKKLKESSFSL